MAEAADGIEAVTGATALRPALVLLDLDMPRLDGMSALPLIVAQVPTTRVVVLSGHATDARLDQARRAGAAGCMQKGVADIPALLLKILGAVPSHVGRRCRCRARPPWICADVRAFLQSHKG